MTSNAQGVYAPLPQSLSDSDSEKELHQPTRMKFSSRKLQNGLHDFTSNSNGYSLPKHIIMAKSKKGFWGMSTMRKCAFISSIALCFIVVFVFLWVLPCSSHSTCPVKITSWKNDHGDIEFIGKINIIRGPYKNSLNLALLTKTKINSNDDQSGVIALQASNGAVSWFLPQVRTATELNCDLIDVNADGVMDCLLLGEIGLEAINPLNADIIWHVHTQKMLISHMDFPTLLPDLNVDGINEMITVTNWNSYHNKILIICGRTGKLLAETIIKLCVEITEFKFEDNLFIFLCKNDTTYIYYKIPLFAFKNKLNNSSYFIQANKIEYQPKRNVDYVLYGHRLIVQNKGECPNCHTNIALLDDITAKRLYGWTHANTYAMNPVLFAFKATKTNLSLLKGHINGFILKLWQWPDNSSSYKRTVNNSTIKSNNVSEKIVLITFNDTNVHVINVSFVQITQLCFSDNECQPNLFNRNNSLQISDLDLDGSQELISYSTTFKCNDDFVDNCNLVSTIEVVRLEAELPKLYAK